MSVDIVDNCYLFINYYKMENIILKKSSKIITDCWFFTKDSSTIFRIEFIDYRKTWKTYVIKSWEHQWEEKDELEKYFRLVFVDKKILPSDLQKKSDSEICQELKGKSLLITTSIA